MFCRNNYFQWVIFPVKMDLSICSFTGPLSSSEIGKHFHLFEGKRWGLLWKIFPLLVSERPAKSEKNNMIIETYEDS